MRQAVDGTQTGWGDLLTGADYLESGAPAAVYHAVVAAWLGHADQRCSPRHRATASTSGVLIDILAEAA